MKKIIFTGCSYTFGAGIDREYPNTPTTEIVPLEYKLKNCTYEQLEFIKEHRFSKLVADMFGIMDLNNGINGGDIDYGLNEIKNHFETGNETAETIAAIIFQITTLDRGITEIYSQKNEKWIEINFQVAQMEEEREVQKITDLMLEYDIDFEELIKRGYKQKLEKLVISLKKYEEMGIPVFIIHWRDAHPQLIGIDLFNKYGDLISNIEWFTERRIPFKYKEMEGVRFSDIYLKYPELIVNGNIYAKQFDDHATILGHKVIADNIYDYIKNKVNI